MSYSSFSTKLTWSTLCDAHTITFTSTKTLEEYFRNEHYIGTEKTCAGKLGEGCANCRYRR
ncbi:MAG: hypothetical protein Fur0017_30520 [Anaerolineales bacterium]